MLFLIMVSVTQDKSEEKRSFYIKPMQKKHKLGMYSGEKLVRKLIFVVGSLYLEMKQDFIQ